MSANGEYWVPLLSPGSEVDGLRRTHDEVQLPYVKQMCVSPICQKVITKSAIRQSHVSKSPIKQSGCNGSLHGGGCNPPRFLPDTMYLQHHYPVAGEILRHKSRGSSPAEVSQHALQPEKSLAELPLQDTAHDAMPTTSLLEERLRFHGLQIVEKDRVHWLSNNPEHPRNWTRTRKSFDVFMIVLLDLFT